MEDELLLKIDVIGSTDLKSKLIKTFSGYHDGIHQTTGIGIITKRIKVMNNLVKLILFDPSMKEIFRKIRPSYYRGASSCLNAFDKGNKDSFKAVKGWFKEFRKYIPDPKVPIGLAGLITNSEEVTTEEGKVLADELGMSYYETTVSDRSSIKKIFFDLTKKMLLIKQVSL